MKSTFNTSSSSLAQTLAIQSQIHLPGTVGRILKQIRDIERVAPLFVEAGLVRSIDRPNPLNVRVAGIATQSTTTKTIGGFLYAAAAVRVNLAVENNVISTLGQDSTCELDDINRSGFAAVIVKPATPKPSSHPQATRLSFRADARYREGDCFPTCLFEGCS